MHADKNDKIQTSLTKEQFCIQHSRRVQVASLVSCVFVVVVGKPGRKLSMKTSTKFATLAFGATSLIALVVAPASAQTVGGSKCSQLRDMDKTKQCLTRATDNILEGPFGTYTDEKGNINRVRLRPDGSGSWIIIDPKTGEGLAMMMNARTGRTTVNTFTTRPGGGGSGGKRSTN
jgi:hypothetical protein